jgi:hypothetical protein
MTMVAEKLHTHNIATTTSKPIESKKTTTQSFTKQPLAMSTQQRCQVSSLWPSEKKTTREHLLSAVLKRHKLLK